MTFSLLFYLFGSFYYSTLCYKAFQQDTDLTAQEKRSSWIVLIVATLLWPLVLPLSCLEKKSIKHLSYQTHEKSKELMIAKDKTSLQSDNSAADHQLGVGSFKSLTEMKTSKL